MTLHDLIATASARGAKLGDRNLGGPRGQVVSRFLRIDGGPAVFLPGGDLDQLLSESTVDSIVTSLGLGHLREDFHLAPAED